MESTGSAPVHRTAISPKVDLWSSSTSDRFYSSNTASRPTTTSMGAASRPTSSSKLLAPRSWSRRAREVTASATDNRGGAMWVVVTWGAAAGVKAAPASRASA